MATKTEQLPLPVPPAAPPVEPPPPAPAGEADQVDRLRDEVVRDRLDAVAARAHLDEAYLDVAQVKLQSWLKEKRLEPTKQNIGTFVEEFKKSSPALFGAPANTAPVMPWQAPSAPAPSSPTTPLVQWRQLEQSGRRDEAEAFYLLNRNSILRSA